MSESNSKMEKLPLGWISTKIGEVCDDSQYGWTTSAGKSGKFLFLRTTDITSGQIDWTSVPYCKDNPKEPEKYLLCEGDIVISRAGSVGYSHLVKNVPPNSVFASYLIRFRPRVLPEYVGRFLQTPEYWRAISSHSVGIAVQNVNATKLRDIDLPLAPLPEQKRIVGKVDELFSELDAAIASLKRVQANLKRYRASVLKAACEGKLVPTEAELAKKKGRNYEPASVLLERILKERREKWNGRGKYKEPAAPDTRELAELPEGWTWATVEQLGEVQLGRQRSPRHHSGEHMRPYLRVANVFEDRFVLDDVKEMNFTPEEFLIYRLEKGDILLNEGQSLELVGRPAMYRGESDRFCFQNTLVRFRANSGVNPMFALMVFRAYLHNGRFQKIARWTTNIAHLGADRFAKLEFALPPLVEQKRIVEEVERRLSETDHAEKSVAENLARASRLRQSILKKAFEGKLVPQDPNDEPASVLLERIKAEREVKKVAKADRVRAHVRRGRPVKVQ